MMAFLILVPSLQVDHWMQVHACNVTRLTDSQLGQAAGRTAAHTSAATTVPDPAVCWLEDGIKGGIWV